MAGNGDSQPTDDQHGTHVDTPSGRSIRLGGFDLSYLWLAVGGGLLVVAVLVVIALVMILPRATGPGTAGALLHMVPADSTAIHIQRASEILDGRAPDNYQDAFETSWNHLEDLGFSVYEVDTLVWASDSASGNQLLVMGGEFEFEAIRDELSDAWGYQDSEYRGYEVWEGRRWEWPVIALFESDGVLLMANRREAAREVFRNLQNGSGSLVDEKDSRMRQFLDAAGDGWAIHPVFGDCGGVDRCQALAYALSERNADSANIVAVLLFSSRRAAERAADDYDQVYDFLNTRSVYGGELEVDIIESRGNVVHAEGVAWFDQQ